MFIEYTKKDVRKFDKIEKAHYLIITKLYIKKLKKMQNLFRLILMIIIPNNK